MSATSTVSTPLAAPSSSSTAMPPVPSSCAAIMRSASPGPRRIRTSPSATIKSTKPAAPIRNSAKRPPGSRALAHSALLGRELLRDRLRRIEAVVEDARGVLPRPGTVPGSRLVMVANELRAWPRGRPVRYETKPVRSGRLGESARRATSIPASTDCHRKRGPCASSARRISRVRPPAGGGAGSPTSPPPRPARRPRDLLDGSCGSAPSRARRARESGPARYPCLPRR